MIHMARYCQEHDIKLLAYGTLCGGLLSERYLGQPAPGWDALNTASLHKYMQMIDVWGGWGLFQELLAVLDGIVGKHEVSIGDIAVRYILDRPAVARLIACTRLGITDHLNDNIRVFNFTLDSEDIARIETILGQSRDLYQLIGDCDDEYRR